MIAEDQYENRLLLQGLMADIGLETKLAENGECCLEPFKDWHPDLIWMDRRMPVMDGEETARRIRGLSEGGKVKFVAVTASAFSEQLQEMLEAGMDGFIRKPYRAHEIYDCLAKQLGLDYRYAEKPETMPEIAPLTPEMLSQLPADLRCNLTQALENLESGRIAQLISQIGGYDENMAAALGRLADRFDYPAILKLLQV